MTRQIDGKAEIAFILGPPMLIAEREVPEHIAAPFRVWAKSLFAPEELGEQPTLTVDVTASCTRYPATWNDPEEHEHTNCAADSLTLYDEEVPYKVGESLRRFINDNFGDVGPLDDVTQYEGE